MKVQLCPIKSNHVDLFIKTFNDSLGKFEGEMEMDKWDIVCNNQEIYINNEFVGFVGYQVWEVMDPVLKINECICNFMIFEEFRGKGYGTLALEEMVRTGKNKYNMIYCYVSPNNTDAIKFYLKKGMFVTKDHFYINKIVPEIMYKNDDGSYVVIFWEHNKRVLPNMK